ncbi:hypothetical protein ACQEV4_25650 [Streptomyces shenzhenensis]|uniref:hypothetical protein n=1 Tax=Streptomyces shenzhenensis TaxID=943815 RepID=UPI003D94DAE8
MAGTKFKAAPRPRQHSWGHAVITKPDRTRREGKPGGYTPAAAFGSAFGSAGGTFVFD